MPLPREIIDRVDRVYHYHVGSKYTYENVRAIAKRLEWSNQPSPYRSFEGLKQVKLPTTLMDAPVPVLSLLNLGLEAVPESQLSPPADLKTLATWLFLSYGVIKKREVGGRTVWLRTCPSSGALYPCELYLAALSVQGLESGLYHYHPQKFLLTKLREGGEMLAQMTRGRPDLLFLKTVPAVALVSTVFARTSWKYRSRGFRYAVDEAGQVVQNLVAAAGGLGIQTVTRLRLNDRSMRELIGVSMDAPYGDAEAVQAMVVWGDPARKAVPRQRKIGAIAPAAPNIPRDLLGSSELGPVGAGAAYSLELESPPGGSPTSSLGPSLDLSVFTIRRQSMAPIPRAALSAKVADYPEVLKVQVDCMAPGVGLVEVRPPLTELSPLAGDVPVQDLPYVEVDGGLSVREVLMKRTAAVDFQPKGISRNQFMTLNRLVFRGGTFFPLLPDGPHAGIVRPFWVVNNVVGMERGVWYYHPVSGEWSLIRRGDFHLEAEYLALEQASFAGAAAVCFMAANMYQLLTRGGPDTYRLAHLEAGVMAQRTYQAAGAMGLGWQGIAGFYDDEVNKFLDLNDTGWEVIYGMAIGYSVEDEVMAMETRVATELDDWRD